ncbi:Adenylosuccinate lyase [Lachnellula subtilissima]|uniref:Adenylosuccinate lyase n=1 Tax=Lachnellula subtilissima TaxID=602034 RepID=A0A8H8RE15_9HELO|nr:Adenylosuccinate lyase [Lachnellula subtilissima]
MSGNDTYQTPLASRYASAEMKTIFSARTRSSTWRQLWAKAEKELGIDIPDEAIAQMKAHITMTDEDFIVAAVEEKRRRHDVMAHVHAFGLVAPAAAGIIVSNLIDHSYPYSAKFARLNGPSDVPKNLGCQLNASTLEFFHHYGATSCYVTDNSDLIFLRDGLDLILPKLATIIHKLSQFAIEYKDMPTLGYTHYQPAQLITVGRRAAQWIQDLLMVLEDITRARSDLRFRGAQGTTGTQASFMEIFHGDGDKVDKLNEILCTKAGFPTCYSISTQTYTRLVDLRVGNALSEFGDVVQRITGDIRHLASQKEMEEPFEKDQIGSSAMAYVIPPPPAHRFPSIFALSALLKSKRNPMRCERIAGLGRHLSNLNKNASDTYSAQWFERTLDDSAIRRITIPEAFLSADAICMTLDNVVGGLVVYPARIHSRVMEELPFMATENIIMKLVSLGKSRQDAHEEIRVLSHQASDVVKKEGGKNDLIERIKKTPFFQPIVGEVDGMLEPKNFIGRCPEQVLRFCGKGSEVEKALEPYRKHIAASKEVELAV